MITCLLWKYYFMHTYYYYFITPRAQNYGILGGIYRILIFLWNREISSIMLPVNVYLSPKHF